MKSLARTLELFSYSPFTNNLFGIVQHNYTSQFTCFHYKHISISWDSKKKHLSRPNSAQKCMWLGTLHSIFYHSTITSFFSISLLRCRSLKQNTSQFWLHISRFKKVFYGNFLARKNFRTEITHLNSPCMIARTKKVFIVAQTWHRLQKMERWK